MSLPQYRAELESKDIPILILVNSTQLRDVELPDELKKWGCAHPVKIACYQTAHKWQKEIGLLIADEMDFALSEGARYARCFTKNSFTRFLGLTGTLIPSKFEKSIDVFQKPPFYRYELKQAQLDGVINKTKIWIHEVPLYVRPTATAPYGEVAKYKWITQKINEAMHHIGLSYDLEEFDQVERWKRTKAYWESSGGNKNSRMHMMRTAESLHDYAALLIKAITKNDPNNKILIFSELTEQVDLLTGNRYHGKEHKKETLENFNEGVIRELGVVKKVNRGVNFKALNNCVVHSYSSSMTNAQQAFIGRMVRLAPDQLAHIHILVSYYDDHGTKSYCRNMNWIKNVIDAIELNHIDVEYYDKGL